jgi:cytochrome c biogenesis protein CcmG/thiol:disulfide interchange protein DsbE
MRFRSAGLARAVSMFALLCLAALAPAGAASKPALTGTQAPAITLPIIANGSGSFVLAQQRGHGVYLNFFSAWCKPCAQEVTTIEEVTRGLPGGGPRVVGVAVLDSQASAQAFIRTHAVSYPIVFDASGDVGAAYRLTKLPLHVFIGPDGVIKQYVEGGPISASELRAGLALIAH